MHRILAALCLFAYCVPTMAQHADLEIEIDGNRLVVDPRIAEGEFGENPSRPNVADEPGFKVDNGVFAPNQRLSFGVTATEIGGIARNLWFWNGTAPVAFSTAPHDLVVQHPLVIELNTRINSLPDALFHSGFQIGQADDEGGIHQDLDFILVNDDESDAAPSPGVYLFGLQTASAGIGNSQPAYVVLASGISEESHELAVDFVATNVVPEPNAVVTGMIGFLAVLGLRRIGILQGCVMA